MTAATAEAVTALREVLRSLVDERSAGAAEKATAFVDDVCGSSDRALMSKTLYQLAAARRRLLRSDSPDAEVVELLGVLHRRVDDAFTLDHQRAYNEEQRELELTVAERVVSFLRGVPPGEAVRPSDISDWLGVDKYQVSRALARLQSDGVVRAVPPPPGVDRRTRWYAFVPASTRGREALEKLGEALESRHPGFAAAVREVLNDPAAESVYTRILHEAISAPLPARLPGQDLLASVEGASALEVRSRRAAARAGVPATRPEDR